MQSSLFLLFCFFALREASDRGMLGRLATAERVKPTDIGKIADEWKRAERPMKPVERAQLARTTAQLVKASAKLLIKTAKTRQSSGLEKVAWAWTTPAAEWELAAAALVKGGNVAGQWTAAAAVATAATARTTAEGTVAQTEAQKWATVAQQWDTVAEAEFREAETAIMSSRMKPVRAPRRVQVSGSSNDQARGGKGFVKLQHVLERLRREWVVDEDVKWEDDHRLQWVSDSQSDDNEKTGVNERGKESEQQQGKGEDSPRHGKSPSRKTKTGRRKRNASCGSLAGSDQPVMMFTLFILSSLDVICIPVVALCSGVAFVVFCFRCSASQRVPVLEAVQRSPVESSEPSGGFLGLPGIFSGLPRHCQGLPKSFHFTPGSCVVDKPLLATGTSK